MTDQPPVTAAPVGAPVSPQIAAAAALIRASGDALTNLFHELAPYVLVGIVVIEVVNNGQLSAFATHVLDGVFGAGLMAIKTGGRSSAS
jgi:hypothetical protein